MSLRDETWMMGKGEEGSRSWGVEDGLSEAKFRVLVKKCDRQAARLLCVQLSKPARK